MDFLKRFIQITFNNSSFVNPDYLLNDLFFITNVGLALCIFIFFYNISNPFVLIVILEIMYLLININFITSWVFAGFFNGLTYVLLIIGIAGAETIIGLVIIIKIYTSQNAYISDLKAK